MSSIAAWFVARTSRRRVLIALATMVVVQILGAIARSHPAVMRVTSSLPDIHPGYDGPGLVVMIGRLAEDRTATWVAYGLDMLNPTTGGAFFGLLLAMLLVATGREHTRWRHVIPVLLLALSLDIVENIIVLGLVASYPSDLIATMHQGLKALTLVKFSLMAVGFAGFLALAVEWYRQRRARGNSV